MYNTLFHSVGFLDLVRIREGVRETEELDKQDAKCPNIVGSRVVQVILVGKLPSRPVPIELTSTFSGLEYSKVPPKLLTCPPFGLKWLKPKSTTMGRIESSNNTFDRLRSS